VVKIVVRFPVICCKVAAKSVPVQWSAVVAWHRNRNVGREGRTVLKVVQTDLEGQCAAVERTFTEGALAPRRQGWPWPTS
jgi:hypothetical protein